MRYLTLCTDYDGTIAHNGRVDAPTIAALEELRASGRKLVLVTGREIDDLQKVFDRVDLFERVVAENGALIYRPATREERVLHEAPPAGFVAELRRRGVDNLSSGRCIVATWEPHERQVLETIRDLGLELQVVFNKGAVMVLPSGVNKATGLRAALDEMNVSVHNSVGVGDAENDHAFLSICECSAAVSNALPAVKEKVDIVLEQDHGAGVRQLIGEILKHDLENRAPALRRHEILLGQDERGEQVTLPAWGISALVVGTSGGGKSTVAVGLVERLKSKGYAFCIIDPEGDYDAVEGAAVLGSPERAPSVDECMQLLAKPGENAVINLVGLKFRDRPGYFMTLFTRMRELRARTGRPHWLVVDEAHHVLPADWQPTDHVLPPATRWCTAGERGCDLDCGSSAASFSTRSSSSVTSRATWCASSHRQSKLRPLKSPWKRCRKARRCSGTRLRGNNRGSSRSSRRRPNGNGICAKYAEGSLGEDRSFYFRGREGKLKLRAHNLIVFTDLADGVDDETWLYHWKRGEVSEWVRTSHQGRTAGQADRDPRAHDGG